MGSAAKIGFAAFSMVPIGLTALFGFAYYSVSNPQQVDQPLPEGLISLSSPEGEAILASATATADVEALRAAFQTQEKGTWCGVASSATVLSVIEGRRVSQEDFFTDRTAEVRTWLRITFGGMTVEDLGALLETHGVETDVHHADIGIDRFRELTIANLSAPGDYVLINYRRTELAQGDSGHISPLGAYDAASDRFLVLDVASYKWPPVWVTTADLFAAIDTVDPESGLKRGFVLVRP